MTLIKKLGTLALSSLFVATLPALADEHQEPEFTFSIHHFLSPKAVTQTKMIKPWAERIEAASDGRIKFEIFPSMSLGGKPPELYRQVRDGSADIVWTLIGYTPGVFPRSEVFELPSVHVGSAEQTNRAIQDSMDLIAEDYADLHPLLVHVHAGNALHLVEPLDLTADDPMKGLKLRTPSRTGAWLIEALGAEPVGMPVPALPQALAKGTVDGAFVPYEVTVPLKLADLTAMSVEGENGERFGTSVFLYAMNKDSYASLPDDLKKIIDEHSGEAFAIEMGKMWDGEEERGKTLQEESGGAVATLDADKTAELTKLGEGIVERWIDEVAEKDIEGMAIVEHARKAMDVHKPEE